jgi:hypothetical protein
MIKTKQKVLLNKVKKVIPFNKQLKNLNKKDHIENCGKSKDNKRYSNLISLYEDINCKGYEIF